MWVLSLQLKYRMIHVCNPALTVLQSPSSFLSAALAETVVTATGTDSSPPKPKWHHWPFVSVKYCWLVPPYGDICLLGPRCYISPPPPKKKKNCNSPLVGFDGWLVQPLHSPPASLMCTALQCLYYPAAGLLSWWCHMQHRYMHKLAIKLHSLMHTRRF